MTKYTDVYEMSSLLLVMEYERLLLLEAQGEKDENTSYDASELREQIEFRLGEYDNNR